MYLSFMPQSQVTTVTEYLNSLPMDRKKALTAIRKVFRKNLNKGFQESFNWGMITYEVPLKTYPETYNGQPLMYAAIASQKNHFAVYLSCVYMDPKMTQWIRDAYEKHGFKLTMGKSCIRFKKLEEIPLDAIGRCIKSFSMSQFIKLYETSRKQKSSS
jgi:hypothetical protein